jgi:long-chain acyl-CoA synthetase
MTDLSVEKNLDGLRIILIGGTGFLGKVLLGMLLHRFPKVEHVYMVVRSRRRKDGSLRQNSEARFWSEIITSAAFDPFREANSKDFSQLVKDKITVLDGDVTIEFAGISNELRASLRGKVDVLVNSSGVVDFNPPLDKSLEVNAFGMQNLVALAKDLGDIPFLHTSTAYVAGDRTGQVDEVDPRVFPFPKADELDPKHWDPEREIEECMEMVRHAVRRAKDAFRQSDFLDNARQNLKSRNEPTRGEALQDELEKVERRFIEQLLVQEGTERAQFWGWHNIYTYTKSIGEQILCASGLPFTIVRPAVIESSLEYPKAGWNEGINTSAPLIYLINQGPLGVPTSKDSVLDVIPVDHVAIGMILSMAELAVGKHKAVYQYGTSDSMPLKMHRLVELVSLHKRLRNREERQGTLAGFIQQRVEAVPISVSEYYAQGPRERAKQLRWASNFLAPFKEGPLSSLAGPAAKGLKTVAKNLDLVAKITDQFVPFTATHNYRFSSANTREAYGKLTDEEKEKLPWNPESIDWYDYLLNIHCPGLVENVFPLIEEKKNRESKPLRPYDHLIDLLDEIAERYDHIPALMRTHEEGFARISFREMRERAISTAAALLEAGVQEGDRILLSGQNHPSWPIAYFGILRAGGVAVPMDIALTEAQALNIEKSAEPALAVLDEEAMTTFGHALETRVLHLGLATAPRAKTEVPMPAVNSDTLASILYTSGTTGDPKGVMLTHGNFTALLGSLGKVFPLSTDDRVLSVLPLHHTFEFSCGLLMPLSQGAQIIYLDEITGENLSRGLKEGQVTAMVGVPALWQLLERRIHSQIQDKGDLFENLVDGAMEINRRLGKSTKLDIGRLLFAPVHGKLGGKIRFLISGGAALPKDTHQFFSGLGLHLTEGYGLTEAAPVLTVSDGQPGAKSGNVGKPIPGVSIKIKDPDENGIGEVIARGSNVMQGYYNLEKESKMAVDGDGWLHTGDMGKFDHSGRLQLVGRAKEVVVTAAGENIYLDDVESSLGKISFVKEYVLVGLSDNRGGERLGMLGVIDGEVKKPRQELERLAQDAIKKVVDKLPVVQRPSVFHLVDADLPRTRTRKIKRSDSKKILERIIAAAPVQGLNRKGISAPIINAVATVTGTPTARIHSGTKLRDDLGLDSLMAVELASALGTLGKGLPDADEVAKCETVADLVKLIGEKPVAENIDVRADAKRFPEVVASPLKTALGIAQFEFYGRGMKTKVVGRSNIPQNRQLIVVSNHCSHLDMGLVKFGLGKYGRKLVALAAKDYFFEGNPWVVAYFEQLTNLEPIDRKRGYRASLRQACDIVNQGKVVLLFPEGTRRIDGTIGDFKPLMGQLALETEVDILPLYLEGTFEAMPKGAVLPRRRGVTVHIGPPISIKDVKKALGNQKMSKSARVVAKLAQTAIETLRDGNCFDLSREDVGEMVDHLVMDIDVPSAKNGIANIFENLRRRYNPDRIQKSVSWYFSLDGKDGPRYTVSVDSDNIDVRTGRPTGKADCVVKTSAEMLRKMVLEAYVPEPSEFVTGRIKTSDIPLLMEFQRVFNLREEIG